MSRFYDNHVVLGAGGAIARALVPELLRMQQRVTLVSRHGNNVDGTSSVQADLTDRESVSRAVPEGSAVYLTAGLPYDIRVWTDVWPRIIANVIQVCREKSALLVFFDNVYSYGLVEGAMTEETPYKPSSHKGMLRARIAEQIAEEYSSGRMQGLIARSADFYGPGADSSGIPNAMIFARIASGKSGQWFGSLDRLHSLTYTNDCGRALPLLVADEAAYNQVWHLPTAHPPVTMRNIAELAAVKAEVKGKPSVLPGWMVGIAGLFDRTSKELQEMLYQYKYDYVFDSSKFEKHFSFAPTPYEQGVSETLLYHQHLAR